MKEQISIVVPVYNVEQYLEKCVNSIINQTYKNLEIILIDDGATDSSGKLCDELAKIDNRIKVYHKENGGLSDARNYGVERATGDYIGFVDSDDYIDSEMYEKLYEAIKKEDVDVAECNFRFIYSNRITNYTDDKYYLVLNKDEYTKEYVTMNRIFGAAWTKLIKSSLAKEIKFPKGKLFEDGFYSLELMKKARNFVIFDSPYYNYVMRENSITTNKFSEKSLDIFIVCDKVEDYFIKNNNLDIQKDVYLLLFRNILFQYKLYITRNHKYRKKYEDYLAKYAQYLDKYNHMELKLFRLSSKYFYYFIKLNILRKKFIRKKR